MWVRDHRGRQGAEVFAAAETLARAIEARVGVPTDIEACHRWTAFLPDRTNGSGAITEYFGSRTDGDWKVRSIELRQHSSNDWVGGIQRAALDALAADHLDREGRPSATAIHTVAAILRSALDDLDADGVPMSDLIETRRVDRELSDDRAALVTAAALERARQFVHHIPVGHTVRFVVLDEDHPVLARRVMLVPSSTATAPPLTRSSVCPQAPMATRRSIGPSPPGRPTRSSHPLAGLTMIWTAPSYRVSGPCSM